jgi:hypothetical protein
MSMQHKAFVFNYGRFQAELASVLYTALETDSVNQLISFIAAHQKELCTPAEGEPLSSGWESELRTAAVDRAGAVALTAYYDPLNDIGLQYRWQELRSLLPDSTILFGVPFGPAQHLFDPGKMGAWFQYPELVRTNDAKVRDVASRQANHDLSLCLTMFRRAIERSSGLYVTF